MNNKYGEHPKKRICIFKDYENNQEVKDYENNEDNQNNQDNQNNEEDEQNENNEKKKYNESSSSSSSSSSSLDSEDNQRKRGNQYNEDHEDNEDYDDQDNQNNEDHEQIEYNEKKIYNESSSSSLDSEDNQRKRGNQYNEDHEDNEDYDDNETDEYDLSAPRYSYDNDGNANVFLIGESAQYFRNPDHYDDLMNEYHNLPKNFNHTDKNYVVKKLDANIDFKEIQTNDILELKINRFFFNNLIDINLSLFLDQQFEPQAVKFIQSILNLQTLKKFFVLIVPKFCVEQEEYVEKIQKQLEFKNHINLQSISVYNSRYGYYGFDIFSDEGKIKKLFFYSFAEIKLDIQQLESVEELEIHQGCDYYSCRSMNEFLKKLINLKYLKLKISDESDEQPQIQQQFQLLQSICELKQIKKLELNCESLPSENIECLTINFEETMMAIQSENLSYLNIKFSLIEKPLSLIRLKQQLSTLKNLKTLKMFINLQEERHCTRGGELQRRKGIQLGNRIRQQLIKQFKKLIKLDLKLTVC